MSEQVLIQYTEEAVEIVEEYSPSVEVIHLITDGFGAIEHTEEVIEIVEEYSPDVEVIHLIEGELGVIEHQVPGPPGPQGVPGVQGIPGPSGDDYVFEQVIPDDEWTVTHNLGRYPIVGYVIDSTGQVVGTEIVHDSVNQFRSLSDGAMTGWVPYS